MHQHKQPIMSLIKRIFRGRTILSIAIIVVLSSFGPYSYCQGYFIEPNTSITYEECSATATITTRLVHGQVVCSLDDMVGLMYIEVKESTDASWQSVGRIIREDLSSGCPSTEVTGAIQTRCKKYDYCPGSGNISATHLGAIGSNDAIIQVRFGPSFQNLFGKEPIWRFHGTNYANNGFDDPYDFDFTVSPGDKHRASDLMGTLSSPSPTCDAIELNWINPSFPLSCSSPDWTINVIRDGMAYDSDIGKKTTWVDQNVIPGQSYDYNVELVWKPNATSRTYTTPHSNKVTTNSIGPLSAPSLNQPTGICDQGEIVLKWNPINGASGYRIERSTDITFPLATTTPIPISGGNTNEYTDSGLTSGTIYHYRLYALNCMGTLSSPPSQPRSAAPPSTPATPIAVTAVANNVDNSIDVTWTDASVDEDDFVIVRTLLGAGPTEKIVDLSDATLVTVVTPDNNGIGGRYTFKDSPLAPCQSYAYTVKARNACGDSPESASISLARIDPNLADAFTGPKGSFEGSKGAYTDRIQLEWTSPDADVIDDYRISRRILGSGDNFVLLQEVSGGGIYQDLISDAGLFYEYQIVALLTCEGQRLESLPATTIGFRSKSGRVSGNVAYAGGTVVPNVKIKADRDVIAVGTSLSINGCGLSISHNTTTQELGSDLLLETWLKPSSYGSPFTVISKQGAYELTNTGSNYQFKVFSEGNVGMITMPSSALPVDNWNSISAQVRSDSVFLYANGVQKAFAPLSGATDIDDPVAPIIVGSAYDGLMRELRIWKIEKSNIEVKRLAERYVTAAEAGLVVLLPMTEGNGSFAYDRSKSGASDFNNNHAEFSLGCAMSISWVSDGPSQDLLSYISYTGENGSYQLDLPYANEGESYTLTPSFPQHTFNPTDRVLFVGNSSTVINGVDFIDASSFIVEGFVRYKGYEDCGVPGVFMKVDGEILIKDGEAEVTDANGYYNIEVPIGNHFVSVEKSGHVFNIGRFDKNFTKGETAHFQDSTTVRLVGRVVGGTIERDKKPGLGLSKNNIGRAKLTFAESSGCMTVMDTTDATTGEYAISLPPLLYDPTVEMLNGPSIDFAPPGSNLAAINLVNPLQPMTVSDSLFDDIGQLLNIDSVVFEKRVDYIHRVTPKIVVTQNDGVRPFIGDTSYTYVNPINDEITIRNLWTDPMRWPVFANIDDDHIYRTMIKVYEEYENADHPGVIDSVPTVDGTLYIENELSSEPDASVKLADVNDPDTLRSLIYSFQLGTSNLLYNQDVPEYSFTRKFEIRLDRTLGEDIYWKPYENNSFPTGIGIPTNGDETYRAYILAPDTNGEQFVTNGPERPEFVLRDPPGSGSSATRDVGSTTSKSESWAWDAGGSAFTNDKISAGAKFVAGIGIAISTDIEVKTEIGFKAEVSGGRNGSLNKTITNTESWSTNSSPNGVGAGSDLFIGTSQNVQFGITEILAFIPEELCGSAVSCIDSSVYDGMPFKPAILSGLSLVPDTYETGFIYTQDHIINTVIPQLYELRDIALTQADSKYSNVLPVSDTRFGKNNDDPVFTGKAPKKNPGFETLSGASYTYNAIDLEDSLTGDIVRNFNNQIALWEENLRLNEWEKVNIDNQIVIDSLKDEEIKLIEAEYIGYKAAFAALKAFEAGGGIPIAYGIIANPLPGTAAGGYATFAATSAVAIAGAEVAQFFNEYKFKLEQIEDRFGNTDPKNRSFNAGSSFTSSITQSLASSIENSFEYTISADLKLTVEGLINNNGVGLEKGLGLKFKSSRKWGEASEETETVSYTLTDDDDGDFYSVDIYPSMFGWGPIFKRKPGGLTSCPYEGEEVTQYYQEGTIIHPATQQVDSVTLSVPQRTRSGIPADQAAVFNLTIGNETSSNQSRTYQIGLANDSNPFGAIVRIDGQASSEVTVPAGSSVNKVLTIEKGAGETFDYTNLEIVVFPECDPGLGVSEFLSVSFIPTCTPVTLRNPDDFWVLNDNFNNTMPIRIEDYNYNTFGLEQFIFEMKPADEANFSAVRTFYKDSLPTGISPMDADSFDNSQTLIDYDWLVSGRPDGVYDLRVSSLCKVNGIDIYDYSEIHRGYMDRVLPRAFGTPSPGDGILDPNDDIILTMNETIDIGSVGQADFEIFGRLNGATMGPGTEHKSSVGFDGSNSSALIPEYQLQKRSFTIEFYLNRKGQGQEVVLSQGASVADQLLIHFDANNYLNITLGNENFKLEEAIPADEWHHYAIIYNREDKKCTIFITGTGPADTFEDQETFITDYQSGGPIGVGHDVAGNVPALEGFMHGLRLWSIPRTTSEINSGRNKVYSGREAGLIGHWAMDDSEGDMAIDIVRSRHMTLDQTTWTLFPTNNSYKFNGSSDYLEATNVGPLVLRDDADITIEAWLKPSASGRQTILSTGKPDATTSDRWDISYDGSSESLEIINDGTTMSVPINLADAWHHFAIVIDRASSVLIYVDGDLIQTGNASDFSGFKGVKLWVGCRGWVDEFDIEQRDQYFNGGLDEIRLWNSARKPEQIKRDRVFQLEGTELGLQVYYPFDDIVLNANNNPTRIGTLEDAVLEGLSLPVGVGFDLQAGLPHTGDFDNDAPTVKLPRVREKLIVDFVVNDDQIFIDFDKLPWQLENVTLDITVEGLKDLAGNTMEGTETWIAYVNKNQVFWETEYFDFTKDINDPLTFTAVVKNTGGSQEIFNLSNIPSWLIASPVSGVLEPNSSAEVSFTVKSGVNIGTYEQDIFVSTDFGFNERLLLDLKITAEPPEWEVDPSDFNYAMNIIGELNINDVISTDPDDMVSVWIDGELRGVSHVERDGPSGKYLVFLTVSSNSATPSDIEFRAWDASLGRLLVGLTPGNLVFQDNSLLGSLTSPQPIGATVLTQLTYYMKAGWNWLSFPLDDAVLSDVNATLDDLSPTEGDEIGTWNRFDRYQSTGSWSGSLEQEGFNTNEGFKMFLAEADTFTYEGLFYDPSLDTIVLEPKWNWIGMKAEVNLELATALRSLNPSQGDVIKSQQQFAIYDTQFGWSGNLDFLSPKSGYMYKSATMQDLVFPGSGLDFPSSNAISGSSSRKFFNKNEHLKNGYYKNLENSTISYSSNMSLTAAISECLLEELSGREMSLDDWMLVARVDGEVRGITDNVWQEQSGQYLFYLTIAGDGAADLDFRLVKKDGSDEIQLSQGFEFSSNLVMGAPSAPYLFTCGERIKCVDDRIYNSEDINLAESVITQRANISISSDAKVPSGVQLRFRAGDWVEFFKGFQTVDGGGLEVFIEDCKEENE